MFKFMANLYYTLLGIVILVGGLGYFSWTYIIKPIDMKMHPIKYEIQAIIESIEDKQSVLADTYKQKDRKKSENSDEYVRQLKAEQKAQKAYDQTMKEEGYPTYTEDVDINQILIEELDDSESTVLSKRKRLQKEIKELEQKLLQLQTVIKK
jgi:predicted  nucleic acid-binding Zn-ribbon protein